MNMKKNQFLLKCSSVTLFSFIACLTCVFMYFFNFLIYPFINESLTSTPITVYFIFLFSIFMTTLVLSINRKY